MQRRAILLAAAFLLTAGCLTGGPLTGKPSPSFSIVTSDGVHVDETTYLGKFVILDLMATWCGPCKLEVSHLREVQARHGDAVVIISIDVDPTETLEDMEAFGQTYGATWAYAIDRNGQVKGAMGMEIIPKLIIIDPQGVVAFEREGEVLPAAISRVIDPSIGGSPFLPVLSALAGLALGFSAAFNPYRRVHRDAVGAGPTLAALGILAGLAVVAWPFSALASTRATYGSLFVGAFALGAAAWWFRARRKLATQTEGAPWQRAGDRAYELGAGFAGALVLALVSGGVLGFFAPLGAFLLGAAFAYANREKVDPRYHEALGLSGLVAVGLGLLAFGSRILFA